VEYDSLLVQHLGHIDRVAGGMARRHQLSSSDTDELKSVVRFKLIDKDFAILKKFQGRSSITTYLTVVVERLCLDFFNERWGKWRPSSAALKLGATAIQLEQLVARDSLSFDEAVNTLQINHGVSESREQLLAIFVRLPIRTVRRLAGEEELALVAARGGAPDPAFDLPEEYSLAAQIETALTEGIAALAPRDRLLIKMHYLEGLPVATIARLLAVEARPLYNHIEDIKRRLRAHLRKSGVDESQVNRIVGHSSVSLGRMFGPAVDDGPENGRTRPSNP
jgi:RNA polymerase sigma factor (sigma-70 family)